MSGSAAIIVCDHGLGHLRRCVLMALDRISLGQRIVLFAPISKIQRLQRVIPSIGQLNVVDFYTNSSLQRFKAGLDISIEWLNRLPSLESYQTVICDNLPEILSRRPDAILSAQFFWHDVIDGIAEDYRYYCIDLLEKFSPKIIGCDLFAMDQVKSQPGFMPVGLYEIPELVAASLVNTSENRTSLLVSGGSTADAREQLRQVVDTLLCNGPGAYKTVYLDPELIPENPPPWITVADYSIPMYLTIKAAICRPGLGVVTDLLTVGAQITSVYEYGNAEMSHNAAVLSRLSF